MRSRPNSELHGKMIRIRAVSEPEELKYLWSRHWPEDSVFDCWGLRKCFVDFFNRKTLFIVAESGGEIKGILPLSWLEENSRYGFFPGETWHGKTWLEQNRIFAADAETYNILLENAPGPLDLRYLRLQPEALKQDMLAEDEVNYACFPGQFNYSFDNYMGMFSAKLRKIIIKELSLFDKHGVSFRHNVVLDLDSMFALNKNTYGEDSYFHDARFMGAFEALAVWLRDKGMLRVTTAVIGGAVAAVDMGALHNGAYTLLAGGTHQDFPGVAKLINLHHIRWACEQKVRSVDFLCGDFGWKSRFHLSARPLYKVRSPNLESCFEVDFPFGRSSLPNAV